MCSCMHGVNNPHLHVCSRNYSTMCYDNLCIIILAYVCTYVVNMCMYVRMCVHLCVQYKHVCVRCLHNYYRCLFRPSYTVTFKEEVEEEWTRGLCLWSTVILRSLLVQTPVLILEVESLVLSQIQVDNFKLDL